MHRARSPHLRAASVPRSYMGGFGRYLLRKPVIHKPGLPFWLPGSGKHITRRQLLILGSASFFLEFGNGVVLSPEARVREATYRCGILDFVTEDTRKRRSAWEGRRRACGDLAAAWSIARKLPCAI